MNREIEIEITGISPILMHAFPLIPVEAIDKKTPEEQAEIAAYRDSDTNELYIPAQAMQRALVRSATFSKGKGRATLQKIVAACVLVGPERASLGVAEYVIDKRAVVIPATQGRVVRYRPRLDAWKTIFTVGYDPDLLTDVQLRRVVDDAGSRVGLLDYRPERNGPFGRFFVTKWE